MKKSVVALLSAATLLAAAVPSMAAYKAEYKLDIVPSLTTGWGKGAVRFADLVRKRTNGRVNIKVYGNAQLTTGKQTNAFMLIYNGTIDFADQSSINWSPQVMELNLWAMPFLLAQFPDRYAAEDAIINGQTGKLIAAAVEKKGVHVLAYGENGFRELTNNKKDIHTPEDFKGVKVRIVGSPLYIDIYNAIGANATNMNWSDTMSAIQQGVIDGQENPVATFYPVKMYEYHKHMLDWHITFDPTLFCVNPKIWKSFSREDQIIIEQSAKDAAKYQIALARVGFDDGSAAKYLKSIGEEKEIIDWYKVLDEKGMKVVKLTPAETKVFVDKCSAVSKKWREKIGTKIVDTAMAEMKAAQKK